MEKFNNNELLRDPFLEKMFHKMPFESTSGNFTKQVMDQLGTNIEPIIEPEKYRRQMLWAYSSIGVGMLVIALMLFALWPFFDFNLSLSSTQILYFINTSLTVLRSITDFLSYLKGSTVQISIFFSLMLLFLVERLLRKGVSNNNSYLL